MTEIDGNVDSSFTLHNRDLFVLGELVIMRTELLPQYLEQQLKLWSRLGTVKPFSPKKFKSLTFLIGTFVVVLSVIYYLCQFRCCDSVLCLSNE